MRGFTSRVSVSVSVSVSVGVGFCASWRSECTMVFGRRADWKMLRRSCWRGSGIVLLVSRTVVGAGSFLSMDGFLGGFLLLGVAFLFGRGGIVGCLIDIKS